MILILPENSRKSQTADPVLRSTRLAPARGRPARRSDGLHPGSGSGRWRRRGELCASGQAQASFPRTPATPRTVSADRQYRCAAIVGLQVVADRCAPVSETGPGHLGRRPRTPSTISPSEWSSPYRRVDVRHQDHDARGARARL